MKVGDLVRDNSPHSRQIVGQLGGDFKHGVIVGEAGHSAGLGCTNKVFEVLWRNGTIGNNVWDHDLEVISEGR